MDNGAAFTCRAADIVIVGAGAAGLATAIFARQLVGRTVSRERTATPEGEAPQIVLLDGAKKPGAKILVSGGSRCNVTNTTVSERDFWTTSGSPAMIRRVLRALPVPATVEWFRQMGVTLQEEQFGKLFPDTNRARDVLDALLRTADQCGARLCPDARVRTITRADGRFEIETNRGGLRAGTVVLATGGQALPKSGSDGGGYELARALGHHIVPTTPALAPLLVDSGWHTRLSGVAHVVDLVVWVDGRVAVRFSGPMLWTHFGVSGPVALDASRHIERARLEQRPVRVTIGLVPGRAFDAVDADLTACGVHRPAMGVAAAVAQWLPSSVAEALLGALDLPFHQPLSQLPRAARRRLAHALTEWELPITGTRGYTFAEATAGGVDLTEVDPATMASRRCPGLYLVGEVLDVDGRLGGFNFQWAWATARVAGAALAAERGSGIGS